MIWGLGAHSEDFTRVEVKTDFAAIRNGKMYFEMAGTGKPLLLLHSGIADHRMWAGQCGEFSRHFQVVMPDFLGYGKSSAPEGPFRHYEDIHALVRHLGSTSVDIAGCSLGGKVAIEMAIAYPEMVGRLILIAPGMPSYEYRDKETLAKDTILEGLITSGKREEVADVLVDIWVVGLNRNRETVDSAARALVREMILDNYGSVTDKYPETPPAFDLMSRLVEIRVPTLVMIGESDLPDMQAISQLVADRIRGAKRLLIPGAAHLPNLENPTLFNQSVIDFLADQQ
jgi:pimeloyl-ACP methyl ester carboxylesterase